MQTYIEGLRLQYTVCVQLGGTWKAQTGTNITLYIYIRGGNLLAPHDSIRFRFRGQRFDSKPILDSKPIIDYQF